MTGNGDLEMRGVWAQGKSTAPVNEARRMHLRICFKIV